MGLFSVISGLGGLASSLLGGGSSSAETSTEVSPADWETLGEGASGLWDEFMSSLMGGDSNWEKYTYGGNTVYYNTETGEYSSTLPDDATEASLSEKMSANTEAEKTAAEEYLEEMGVISSDKIAGSEAVTEALTSTLDSLSGRSQEASESLSEALSKVSTDASTPYISVSLGGQETPLISKRQLALADTLSDIASSDYSGKMTSVDTEGDFASETYDAGIADTNLKSDTEGDQAARELNVAQEYTPYASDIEYFETIWPIIQAFQNNRYGASSSASTASAETSLAEQIEAGTSTASALQDLLESF